MLNVLRKLTVETGVDCDRECRDNLRGVFTAVPFAGIQRERQQAATAAVTVLVVAASIENLMNDATFNTTLDMYTSCRFEDSFSLMCD